MFEKNSLRYEYKPFSPNPQNGDALYSYNMGKIIPDSARDLSQQRPSVSIRVDDNALPETCFFIVPDRI